MKTNLMKMLHDQDREEVAEALANARSVTCALERGKSMNKDEDEDEIVEEKQEDSSFVQTTTMTQADFHDGDGLLSWASSDLPEVAAVSSEVACPKPPEYGPQDTLYIKQKIRHEEKRERELEEEENSQG